MQSARIGTDRNTVCLAGGSLLPSRSIHHMAIKFGRPIEVRDAPRRETALAAPSLDLVVRPRRNRKAEWARRLGRENVLTSEDSILPPFGVAGPTKLRAVPSVPRGGRPTRNAR